MFVDQPADFFPTDLLNALPGSICWMRAVRNDDQHIINFQTAYVNQQARQSTAGDYPVQPGALLLSQPNPDRRLFDELCAVIQTGHSVEYTQFYSLSNEWTLVSRSRFGDGVLITSRPVPTRILTEQTSAKQAQLFDGILDASLNNVFVYEAIRNDEGQIVDFALRLANAAARRDVLTHYGIDPIGKTLLEFLPTSRETGQFLLYCQVTETGQAVRNEHFYPDVQIWYDTSIAKLGDGCVVTGLNMTAAKQADQENKRQAELLNSVLNSSLNGIMSFEAIRNQSGQIVDFRFLTVNEASEQMVGLDRKTMVGNQLLTLFPGNVESGLFATYVKTTETGAPGRTEVYYNHDGLDFWLDVSAQKLGDGFVVTFTDVSVVKRATTFIEQSASRLQTVIDTAQTGIFLFSPVRNDADEVVDFQFRVANRQLAAYVGQEPEAVIGALGSTWFPDYKINGLFDAYYKTYRTGEQQRFDFHYDGSGIDVWLDIMATKIGDEVLVTFGDYTPLKQLQQQLEASVVDLQRSNRNLEQFAYVASHDLQEPLRKIQAFGDIIQTQYGDQIGHEGADLIMRMQSAASRMQVLIKDVLTYSRITTRRETIAPVDLNQLLGEVLDDLETAISDTGALVTVASLPTLNGDALQLRQLFQNLISNALKFAKPGQAPAVTVTARPVIGRNVSAVMVSAADVNRHFSQIEVTDNGIGFDPHQSERIFQVFQRLHGRSTYSGTGIGLAIVQKVVDNHQGYIVAEGRPGSGATFRILLPL